MTLDELKTSALTVAQTYGYEAAVANTARLIQEANPGMKDEDALAAAKQVLPEPAVQGPIAPQQGFFDKYKWYVIIAMLIIGAGGMYWSYSKLKEPEEKE